MESVCNYGTARYGALLNGQDMTIGDGMETVTADDSDFGDELDSARTTGKGTVSRSSVRVLQDLKTQVAQLIDQSIAKIETELAERMQRERRRKPPAMRRRIHPDGDGPQISAHPEPQNCKSIRLTLLRNIETIVRRLKDLETLH